MFKTVVLFVTVNGVQLYYKLYFSRFGSIILTFFYMLHWANNLDVQFEFSLPSYEKSRKFLILFFFVDCDKEYLRFAKWPTGFNTTLVIISFLLVAPQTQISIVRWTRLEEDAAGQIAKQNGVVIVCRTLNTWITRKREPSCEEGTNRQSECAQTSEFSSFHR